MELYGPGGKRARAQRWSARQKTDLSQFRRAGAKEKAPGRLQRPLKLAEDQFVPAPCLCTANQGGESVALARAFHDIGRPKLDAIRFMLVD